MTAAPSFSLFDMDASNPDDKMDVGSSPYRQPEDFDVDLESFREPSIIGSLHDDMIDDPADALLSTNDTMQDYVEDVLLPDDDMLDESNATMPVEQFDTDYNMDAYVEELQGDEDEDILYEEEEEVPSTVQGADGSVNIETSEVPQTYHEVEDDAALEEFEEVPEQTKLDTNQTETFPVDDANDISANLVQTAGQDQASSTTLPEQLAEQPTARDGEPELPKSDATAPAAENQEYDEHVVGQDVGEGATMSKDAGQPSEDVQPVAATDDLEPQTSDGATQDQPHEPADNAAKQSSSTQSVHPVTVVYLEEEMSLFPPMLGDESSVYFLPDSSLAFEPLDKLLIACRDVLIGTLDHHDELVLDVPGLGLHICEDSKYAAQLTLAQILDVYLHLCNNDEGHSAQPLYCHLNSRVSLASQYAYLSSAGSEGKTFAEVAADHMDTPEFEEDQVDTSNYHDRPEKLVSEEQHPQEAPAPGDDVEEEQIPGDNLQRGQSVLDPEVPFQGDDKAISSDKSAGAEELQPSLTAEELSGPSPSAEATDGPTLEQNSPKEPGVETQLQDMDEHEQDAKIEEHGIEGHEGESASSHTVEADPPVDLQENDTDGGDVADLNERPEDLFEHVDTALEPGLDFESYGDEDILGHDGNGEHSAEKYLAHIEDNTDGLEFQDSAEHDPPHADAIARTSSHNGSNSTTAADPEPAGNPSPPLTPVSNKQTKRKAEDDEDLNFLDLDTPDPKRRRPS